ncbi:MAG: hypothetical protein RUDDFDWM_000228 [Candidatus Fervidibacterota bacterium]
MVVRRLVRGNTICFAFTLLIAVSTSAWQESLLSPGEYIPVEQIRPGMRGYCKSTFNGTSISTFPVTVIGILKGVDFGMDLILVRIDGGPIVTKGWGIVSGMSGSPVYISGKLIGAIAYGWAFSRLPVAGVTPIKCMVDSVASPKKEHSVSLPSTPETIRLKPVCGDLHLFGKRISSVRLSMFMPVKEALRGNHEEPLLVPIATPLVVHGMTKFSLERLRKLLQPFAVEPILSPGRPANIQQIRASLEPGAAVGAQLTCGDVELTAIGTVTYRKGNLLIAFGHPFLFAGETSMPLTTAYVHGILPSQLMSIKLASPIKVVGAFTQDRAFALGGMIGLNPNMLDMRISVKDIDRELERKFTLSVFRHRRLTVPLVNLLVTLAFTSVTSENEGGTTFVDYEVKADGLPPIRRQNMFVEDGAGLLQILLGGSPRWADEITQTLLLLQENRFERANVKSVFVKLESMAKKREALIEHIMCDKRVARPGEEVKLKIRLREVQGGWIEKEINLRLPKVAYPCTLKVGVAGGVNAQRLKNRFEILQPRPNSLKQLVEEMTLKERNDQILLCVQLPTMGAWVNGKLANHLPFCVLEEMNILRDASFYVGYEALFERIDVGYVVRGIKTTTIKVEPEYAKEVPQPSPELEKARMRAPEETIELIEQLGQLLGIQSEGYIWNHLKARKMKSLLRLQDEQDDFSNDEQQKALPEENHDAQGDQSQAEAESSKQEQPCTSHAQEKAMRARIVELKSQKELSKGKCNGTFVASDGTIRLGIERMDLVQIDDPGIWRGVALKDGTIYACSWLTGTIYALSKDSIKVVCKFTDRDGLQRIPTTLAVSNGKLLIGTSPEGEIYAVNLGENGSEKNPTLWLKLNCKHIWAMSELPSGDLVIATGSPGRLYRVSKDGKVKLFLESDDEHVLSLAVGNDGTVYAGTYPLGKLWRVSDDGSSKLIYETKRGAIRSLHIDAHGNIYIGTTPHGELLRISRDGDVKLLYDTPSRHIVAICSLEESSIIAGGAMPSALYLVDYDGASGEALKLQNESVSELFYDADGIKALMSISGKLVSLRRTAFGEYISPVLTLPVPASWKLAKCFNDNDMKLSIEARTGDGEIPDETWSEWRSATKSEDGYIINSLFARALQLRLKVEGNARAKLYGISVSFSPVNVPPSVRITSPTGGVVWSKVKTIEWEAFDANGDELEFELYCSSDGGKTWKRIVAKQMKPKEEKSAPQKEAKGEEATPQKGETGITVEMPPAPEISEELLEEGGTSTKPPSQAWRAQKLEWDTRDVPDGVYMLKVIASDALGNPLNPKTAEAISQSFVVDNTPPKVVSPAPNKIIAEQQKQKPDSQTTANAYKEPPQRIMVSDEMTWVARAEFRVDDGEWRPLMCSDGSFDSRYEELIVPIEKLPSGKHVLEIKVFDAGGNYIVFQYLYVKNASGR